MQLVPKCFPSLPPKSSLRRVANYNQLKPRFRDDRSGLQPNFQLPILLIGAPLVLTLHRAFAVVRVPVVLVLGRAVAVIRVLGIIIRSDQFFIRIPIFLGRVARDPAGSIQCLYWPVEPRLSRTVGVLNHGARKSRPGGISATTRTVGHLTCPCLLDPSIVATAIENLEVEDAQQPLPYLHQVRLALRHAVRHVGGRERINLGTDIENPDQPDRLKR